MAMCGTAVRDVGSRLTLRRRCDATCKRSSARFRAQMLTAELPEAPNDRRCAECQLLQHCLPELTSAPGKVDRYMASIVFGCAT